MSVNIKNPEVEDLARRVSAATGESLTGAIAVALRERLDRLQYRDAEEGQRRSARLRAIADDASGRWVPPYDTADHGDLLYDEAGLPR